MSRRVRYLPILLGAGLLTANGLAQETTADRKLSVMAGKALIIDSPADIVRVAIAGGMLAETVGIDSRQILVNGLVPGETSLVIWEAGGARLVYDLTVLPSSARLDAVRQQLAIALGGEDVTLDFENGTAFLRGTVKDLVSAERAVAIASTLVAGTVGKVVDLLYVSVPPVEAQILLKIRFIDVERSASFQLGVNLLGTTGQLAGTATQAGTFTLGDALNLMLFRKDFNLTATLTALETSNVVEILSEPNLLAIDGQQASFLAGGSFPYPTVQGGSVAGAVTIAFQEFGVRLKFLPHVTPRGTIRLHVAPEVSSLDFANGLSFEGYNIPGLDSRKVETEVELESGQSFVIAGLLDKRTTETLSKVPGIGDIPILGKLFQSRTRTPTNSELLVIVTPELVRPIPAGEPLPDATRPAKFLKGAPDTLPRTPGLEVTGPVPSSEPERTVPVEQLIRIKADQQNANAKASPQAQPAPPSAAPAAPAPGPAPAGGPAK